MKYVTLKTKLEVVTFLFSAAQFPRDDSPGFASLSFWYKQREGDEYGAPVEWYWQHQV